MLKKLGLLVFLFACSSAHSAYIYDFRVFTPGSEYIGDPSINIEMQVSDFGTQVEFKFTNKSTIQSVLSEVYFDDGSLLGISELFWGAQDQVKFSQGANPPDLPSANAWAPEFQTSTPEELFSADADKTVNGLSPGEWVAIRFNLLEGKTLSNVINDLNSGLALRVGVHIRSLPSNDSPSVSAVNNVPEPATLAILGIGVLAAFRKRK